MAVAELSGLIPSSAESSPYRAVVAVPGSGGDPSEKLAAEGYVEEEYIASGSVEGSEYSTQVLVRRPADPGAFRGTVIVESIHALGVAPLWSLFDDFIMSRGLGYAFVAAQKTPLEQFVKPSAPERYASLGIEASADLTPYAGPIIYEGNFGSAGPSVDAVSLEQVWPMTLGIMNQVGAALEVSGPFGDVEHLILGGGSQTGAVTITYIKHCHTRDRMPDGSAVYDAYFPLVPPVPEPVVSCDVPVLYVQAEGDLTGKVNDLHLCRRDDSDDPNDPYRHYEIPGASHISSRGTDTAVFGEQLRALADDSPALRGDGVRPNQFPGTMLMATAFQHLLDWVETGKVPPRAERLSLDERGTIARDEHGNALGGVRSSYLDVPTAMHIAAIQDTESMIRLFGAEVPFASEQLAKLYDSHEDYVAKVSRRLDELVGEGWILAEYAEELRAEAEAAAIP